MKTAELTGAALDWAVCKAKGQYQCPVDEYTEVWMASRRYSTDWAQGGPIIEREEMSVEHCNTDTSDSPWSACSAGGKYHFGPTPLIAAMRCYVASVLGDTVDIPEGLT